MPKQLNVSSFPHSPFFLLLNTHAKIRFSSQKMALKLGLPLFLEDRSGRLSGSEYVDMYGRMRLLLSRIAHDEDETVYHIYDQTEDSAHRNTPSITLRFGPRHALGTITFRGHQPRDMSQYISQVNDIAGYVRDCHFCATLNGG